MKKMTEIEKIVMEVLNDGDWHKSAEIRLKIEEINPELLNTKNSLSATLYQMRAVKGMIVREKRGVYALKQFQKYSEEKSAIISAEEKEEMLKLWKMIFQQNIKKASYEMNEKEFRTGKCLYELNKLIENILID